MHRANICIIPSSGVYICFIDYLVGLCSLVKTLIQLIINARIGIKMQTSMVLFQRRDDRERASKSIKQQSAGVRCTEAAGSAELT